MITESQPNPSPNTFTVLMLSRQVSSANKAQYSVVPMSHLRGESLVTFGWFLGVH